MTVFDLRPAERLEIGKLIRRLPRPERLSWLMWCCEQISQGREKFFFTGEVLATERETWEYWEYMCIQKDLDVQRSRAELERRVQLHGRPLLISTNAEPLRQLWPWRKRHASC